MKKILDNYKKDIDSNTLLVGDFNTPLSTMDRSSKQRINKDIVALNDTLDQMDFIDMQNLSPQRSKIHKCTFFSNTRGTLSKIDHMVGHNTSFNKFKKIEIISNVFSDHNGLKLQINLKEKTQKYSNSCTLNYMLLHNEWVHNETKDKIKKVSGNK